MTVAINTSRNPTVAVRRNVVIYCAIIMVYRKYKPYLVA